MRNTIIAMTFSILFFVSCGKDANQNSKPERFTNEILGEFSARDNVSVVYKATVDPQLKADVFIPINYGKVDKHPVLITFHGGAWTGGMPSFMHNQCWLFAEKGFIAIAPSYRTRVENLNSVTPLDSIADAKSIVRWVRKNAAVLHADPDRIVVSGASAGGHLAACTAMINRYDDPKDPKNVSAVPNALILYCPALDVVDDYYKSLLDKPSEARLSSPYQNIRKNLPPVLVFHGDRDEIVPYEKSVSFVKMMQKAGNRAELYTMKGHGHNMYDQDFADTKDKSFEFLVAMGIIEK